MKIFDTVFTVVAIFVALAVWFGPLEYGVIDDFDGRVLWLVIGWIPAFAVAFVVGALCAWVAKLIWPS